MCSSVLLECANYMKKAAAEGTLTRFLQKGATADAAIGYLAIVEGLQELLKVRALHKLQNNVIRSLLRPRITSVD